MIPNRIAIVGPGRVGRSFARALMHSGWSVQLLGRHDLAATEECSAVLADWADSLRDNAFVLVAVPDDAIAAVATRLAASHAITAQHVILHTSGLHDRTALEPLASTGAALGSIHPLQTFVEVAGAPELLRGSAVAIEGDTGAIVAARELAIAVDLAPVVELEPGQKVFYHAGAVFASNYLVVLHAIASRLARTAGAGNVAGALYLPLMQQTLVNVARLGDAALTGPVRRGDLGTVANELAALAGTERELYRALALEALQLSRHAGLDAAHAAVIEALLTG